MKTKNFIVYMKDGNVRVINGSPSIFIAYRQNGIDSRQVDFYTDNMSNHFTRENNTWVKGKNEQLENLINNDPLIDEEEQPVTE